MDLMTLRSLPKSGPVGSASVTSLPSYRSQTLIPPSRAGPPPPDTETGSESGSQEAQAGPRRSRPAPSLPSDASDEDALRVSALPAASESRIRAHSPPPATRGITALSPWSKGLRGTKQEAAARWTRRQVESRHHFVIVRTGPRRSPYTFGR